MDIHETTATLGLTSENYARRLIRAGTLDARLVDGRYDVDAVSVEAYRRRVTERRRRQEAAVTERERRRAEVLERFEVQGLA